jgi:pimeloyl-ACP methyl ester carboxylesterase
MTPPITFTTIQGVRIAQAIQGAGVPVVLLHGWGAKIELVWGLAAQLAPLGYCVYALDLPGFGQSAEPPQAWTVYDYARFVIAYLDAQQLAQVHLFGHSFGGRLSLIIGAEYPTRVQKIVLADSAGIRTPPPLLSQLRLRSYQMVRDTMYRVGARSLADNLRARYNRRYGSTDFQQVSGIMRSTFINVVNEDLLAYAARVSAPTLLFWGDQDQDTPLWQGQKLAKTIPDAGLVVYPGAGHYSYLERLAETVSTMHYFFKQTDKV